MKTMTAENIGLGETQTDDGRRLTVTNIDCGQQMLEAILFDAIN